MTTSNLTSTEDYQREDHDKPIVISGMAGRFPNSDDITEFRDNLFNKIDLVSPDERRWAATHAEIPQRTGKVNLVNKFDAGFFGVHQRQAHTMDPMSRMLLERTFEAILDAGINPSELQGTDTGVFIGACFSESEKTSFYENLNPEKYGIMGCTRSMLAKRISYWFGLQGQSFITDTACSSSLFALEHAYRAIKEGNCNMAIVGGCNLCLHPVVSLQFARLGVLSIDGACKSFDNNANGYARSEAISVIILQKAQHARRIYAEIVHSKTNCDGYKEQGITYPSGKVQKVLLEDFYQECGVDASNLTYVEAHGTGTKVGDPEELGTLDEIFCKGRSRPLLIGSVKSNIGHNEPISGLCSVVKVILAFETGYIPPNIHYNTPRQGVEALETGRMKVVDQKLPLPDQNGLIGINSFGFGGANSHLLLRWNQKLKKPSGDYLPRLVCLSGRTLQGLNSLMDSVVRQQFDWEFIALLQKSFGMTISGHCYRGFLILTPQGCVGRSTVKNTEDAKPLEVIVGDLEGYLQFGRHLFNLPLFAAHVKRLQNFFKVDQGQEVSGNLKSLILHSGVCMILEALGVKIEKLQGTGPLEDLIVKYIKKELSLEETIEEIYKLERGQARPVTTTSLRTLTETTTYLQIGQVKEKIKNSIDMFATQNTESSDSESILNFLSGLGKLYEKGYDLDLGTLYPKPHWPVGRGTPMISPLIKWDHSKTWFVTVYKAEDKTKSGQRVIELSLRDDEWSFLKGHIIDGRCLFPATGYLVLIWETLARVVGKLTSDMKIIFEDVKFLRACTVPTKGLLELILNIRKGSGHFEIVEGGSQVVTGKIYEDLNLEQEWLPLPQPQLQAKEVLTEKDIYKELRLRGYNYRGEFKGLKSCSLEGTQGQISWTGNWIPLMDCMLQTQILAEDTRNLYVPTRISKILIDSAKHIRAGSCSNPGLNPSPAPGSNPNPHPTIPVFFHKDLNIIRCGGIEIRGLWATSIAKRHQSEPVLESYNWSPYLHLTPDHIQPIEEILREFIQIALENEPTTNLKSIEVGLDDLKQPLTLPLPCMSSYIKQALEDQPVVKSQLIVLTSKSLEVENGILVEDKKLNTEFDCYLGVGYNLSKNIDMVRSLVNVLKPGKSFVVSVENLGQEFGKNSGEIDGFEVVSAKKSENYELRLLRVKVGTVGLNRYQVVEVPGVINEDWLQNLKEALQKEDLNVLLWSGDPQSGILGFGNCLRREPGLAHRVTLFWMPGYQTLSLQDPEIVKQLEKRLAVNVLSPKPLQLSGLSFYKSGETEKIDEDDKGKDLNKGSLNWGSYRHFKLLPKSSQINSEHCFVNVTTRGDLSSLKWIQGPLTSTTPLDPEQKLVYVYYSSVNFRDIMTATNRIQADVVTRNRLEQDCVQGFEYSGRTEDGTRVMGMMTRNAMATLVSADVNLLWKVPPYWSLEQSVTIPAVYGTVLYGLVQRGNLVKGEKILIHSATGGVGHAAIHVARYYECQIYVTVGTEEKKEYIRKTFPFIQDEHIGNSRDLSFLQMVLKFTEGKGVDVVLNSLADEKLQASVLCLKNGGRFIEIGKYDLAADSRLALDLIEKQAGYHGVMLDQLFEAEPRMKRSISDLLQQGVDIGFIQPLPTTLFRPHSRPNSNPDLNPNPDAYLEEAFRYMASGKHIGKVVIEVRPEEATTTKPQVQTFKAIPRFYCSPEEVFIINGGLGGFGLELIDWLVLRGARKIIINSSKGISTPYQALRLKTWKHYGTTLKVTVEDLTTPLGVQQLLHKASQLNPGLGLSSITAIFNLAVILKDSLLENQTLEMFNQVLNPKATTTQNLDQQSRILTPNLKHFVVFSSVSCGRGNPGQSNYGLANSVMERIVEQRVRDGFPGLAIQWGAIGDVGLVADSQEENTELVIGGTLQQRVTSCLEVLDSFLGQKDNAGPIVGSMVVAEKKSGAGGASNIVDAVVNILGLRDLKTVSLHSSFPELGMDSMMAVEIKQTLEREYDVFLSPQDIRGMTFSRLQEIAVQKSSDQVGDDLPKGVKVLLRFIANESEADIPIVQLTKSWPGVSPRPKPPPGKLFLLPGIEGMATLFSPMTPHLTTETFCLQFCYTNPEDTIFQMACNQIHLITNLLTSTTFCIAAHSFGCAVALEIVALLEKQGYKGTLILLDGAPSLMKDLIKNQLVVTTEPEFQTSLLCSLMSVYLPFDVIVKFKNQMLQCDSYDQRIDVALSVAPKQLPHRVEYMKKVCNAAFKRMKAMFEYEPSFGTLESKVVLFRPSNSSILDVVEDYGLSLIVGREVEVKFYEGNHVSILENVEMIKDIDALAKGCYVEDVDEGMRDEGKFEGGIVQGLICQDKVNIC